MRRLIRRCSVPVLYPRSRASFARAVQPGLTAAVERPRLRRLCERRLMHVRTPGVIEECAGHLVGSRYEIREAGANQTRRHARLRRCVRVWAITSPPRPSPPERPACLLPRCRTARWRRRWRPGRRPATGRSGQSSRASASIRDLLKTDQALIEGERAIRGNDVDVARPPAAAGLEPVRR